MKKIILSFLYLMLSTSMAVASPATTMSISPSATDGTVITASDENTRNNAISTTYNAHDHNDIDQVGNTLSLGDATAGNKTIEANNADASKPFIRFDDTNNRWVTSNDGSTVNSIIVMTGSSVSAYYLPQSPANNDLLRFNSSAGSAGAWVSQAVGVAGQALTLSGSSLTWSGMNSQGDIEYHNGTSRVKLPVGTAGKFLRSNGLNNNPSWEYDGYMIGIFSKNSADGTSTQSVTGVGFKPRYCIFQCNQQSTGEYSLGWDDGGGSTALVTYSETGGTTFAATTGVSILANEGPSDDYDGKVLTFDSDGFTIQWTATGSQTGTLTNRYFCFR